MNLKSYVMGWSCLQQRVPISTLAHVDKIVSIHILLHNIMK